MKSNQVWKIDLTNSIARSNDGIVLTFETAPGDGSRIWVVVEGNPDKEDFINAGKVFEHEYSKPFIDQYIKKYNTSCREIAELSSKFSLEKGYGVFLSENYLEECMKDNDYLTIDNISIIRSAMYFYGKTIASDSIDQEK